jgi:hypothetical protein
VERSGAAALVGIHAPNGAVIKKLHCGHVRTATAVCRFGARCSTRFCRPRTRGGAQVTEGIRVTDVVRNSDYRVVGVSTLDDERPVNSRRYRHRSRRTSLSHRAPAWTRADIAQPRHRARDAPCNVRDVGEHGEMHVERDGHVGIADVGNGVTTVALVSRRRARTDRRQSR